MCALDGLIDEITSGPIASNLRRLVVAALPPMERYTVKFPGETGGLEHATVVELCQTASPMGFDPSMQV